MARRAHDDVGVAHQDVRWTAVQVGDFVPRTVVGEEVMRPPTCRLRPCLDRHLLGQHLDNLPMVSVQRDEPGRAEHYPDVGTWVVVHPGPDDRRVRGGPGMRVEQSWMFPRMATTLRVSAGAPVCV